MSKFKPAAQWAVDVVNQQRENALNAAVERFNERAHRAGLKR